MLLSYLTCRTPAAVPLQAAAVGFNTLTFGPKLEMGVNWFDYNGQGTTPVAGQSVTNADGSVTCVGSVNGANYNATISTCHKTTGAWIGTAFGGGAYFEATFRVDNPTLSVSPGATIPAWWADDPFFLYQEPGPRIRWTGQVASYGHHIELDMFEWQRNSLLYFNANNSIDWYGTGGSSNNGLSAGNNQTKFNSVYVGNYFTIGTRWVPATPTTKGYLNRYLNDVEVFPPTANPQNTNWNYWDDLNPPNPPPVIGTTAMSWLDRSYMMLVFGTRKAPDGTYNALTAQSCRVFQKNALGNLVR